MLCQICKNSGLSTCYAENNGASCDSQVSADLCDDLYGESFNDYLHNLKGSVDSAIEH